MDSTTASHLRSMNRRKFLHGSGALAGAGVFGLTGCMSSSSSKTAAAATAPPLPFYDEYTPLVPIRAHTDRIFRITVCLRPFRAAGPRRDIEKIGSKTIVHNYGHGGSGWSLSWGAAAGATKSAMAAAEGSTEIAVLGAGAIGLTSATMLQRAGARVTIYGLRTRGWRWLRLSLRRLRRSGKRWHEPLSLCTRVTTGWRGRRSSGLTVGV
jgi:hypothetical protein